MLDVVALWQELTELLACEVDVLTDGGLSPYTSRSDLCGGTAAVKDDRFYLLHVRDAIDDVLAYTSPGREAFVAEHLRQDGVIRKIEVIAKPSRASPRRPGVDAPRSRGGRSPALVARNQRQLAWWVAASVQVPHRRAEAHPQGRTIDWLTPKNRELARTPRGSGGRPRHRDGPSRSLSSGRYRSPRAAGPRTAVSGSE